MDESIAVTAAPHSGTVVAGGLRVHVLSAGTGAPLLYLHGAGDLGMWPPALGSLAGTSRGVRPDHPGFNASDDGPGVDSVAALADRYLQVIDVLGLDRFDLVGTSFG